MCNMYKDRARFLCKVPTARNTGLFRKMCPEKAGQIAEFKKVLKSDLCNMTNFCYGLLIAVDNHLTI